jgi:uncharacterized protein YprB with RNaseH-like and TPR domain/predicted nuclease with RNAse H fold/dephospho-CoA kinase
LCSNFLCLRFVLNYGEKAMLSCSFQHFKGIGVKKETELWRANIFSWKDLIESQSRQLSLFDDGAMNRALILDYEKALLDQDAEFFAERLSRQEHYRIALEFPEKAIFLDIETTGLSTYYDYITVIGWSIGKSYGVYVKGDDKDDLINALAEAKCIVTFNGSLFDLPFVKKEFPGIKIPKAHIDLRFLAKRVGFSGGQKLIEQAIGFKRKKSLKDLRGDAAPILWHDYRRGNLDALRSLIEYNHADIEGMKKIFDVSLERLKKEKNIPDQCIAHKCFSSMNSKVNWVTSKTRKFENVIRVHPYLGSNKPLVLVEDLLSKIDLPDQPRVVGIDLTGSQNKPSGWCFLEDECVTTQRISSDEEIIRATLAVKPHLVSIDSPLSLPVGRTKVTDDDPAREKYGITRHCERMLKKRGVNVYPSLIRSMQALTERGIRLANHFRSLGIPVIESYPGAAQDIMNIPRKGAGVEYLNNGLAEFGVKGVFLDQMVSHDELDAITSAIVGLFFLSGDVEKLGDYQENFLMIPELSRFQCNLKREKRKVIGLSGQIASGKTTAGKYLETCGFHYVRFSLVLADILQERGIEPTREALQSLGHEINSQPGKQRWLCEELLRRLPATGDVVIDGLRFLEDYSSLFEAFGSEFTHIHIKASKADRMNRYISNGSSKTEFLKASEHNVEAGITKLERTASHVIINDYPDGARFLMNIGELVGCEKPGSRRMLACL